MRTAALANKLLFYGIAFGSGFVTLSLELLGFRMLAPYFGYSIYVFGSLIGLILLALALGYMIGGILGAKMGEKRFFWCLLGGGIYISLAMVAYIPLLNALQDMGIIAGSLLATLILYAVPMVIFAAAAPYLVGRLAIYGQTAGWSAGVISGVGTLGSLAGTFLTSFVLLPSLGTRVTFLIIALVGSILPILGLFFFDAKRSALTILIPAILFSIPTPARTSIKEIADSPYSHLEVVDYGQFLALRTEYRSGSAYSIMPVNDEWRNQSMLYSLFAIPPILNGAKRVLLLGLGAGTLPLVHEELNPGTTLKAVEIDPKIVSIGKEYFNLDKRKNIEEIIIEDVRPFLRKDNSKYKVIEMDLFQGGTEIPFYLVTKEFFGLINDHLEDSGILSINVYDPKNEHPVLGSILATLESVYPCVYKISLGNGSFFVLATNNELKLPLEMAPGSTLPIAKYFNAHLKMERDTPGYILVDDHAPLERLYGISS